MTEKLAEYIDCLTVKVRSEMKRSGDFDNAVFYRAFDGEEAPSEPEGFSVCAGIGKVIREKRYFSIYKRKRLTVISAELEFKVSACRDANELSVFCEKFETLLLEADPVSVRRTEISPAKYDSDLNAVYRTVTAECRFTV